MYGLRSGSTRAQLIQSLPCKRLQTALSPKHATSPTVPGNKPATKLLKHAPPTLSNPKLQKLVKTNFPKSKLCFAYGSKVLHQLENLPTPATMTDLMFVTSDPLAWHRENFRKNKHHYSLIMRLVGPRGVVAMQDIRPYCLFNPYVEVEGVLLKYGVVGENHLLRDLQSWDTLYVAGRLHKPVLLLDHDPSFNTSYIKHNLRSALHTALVFLPDRFSDLQLFSVLSHISYFGDVRTVFKFENPNKVRNIVEPNIGYFRDLYASIIDESPFIERTDYGYCQAAKTEKNLRAMEKLLPRKVLYLDDGNINPKSRVFRFDKNVDPKSQLFRKVAAGDVRYIEEQLRIIVMKPSIYQTIKGFITAGVSKSLKYSAAKVKKSKVKKSVPESNLPAVVSEGRLMSSEYSNYINNSSLRNPTYRNNVLFSIAVFTGVWLYLRHREGQMKGQLVSFAEESGYTND